MIFALPAFTLNPSPQIASFYYYQEPPDMFLGTQKPNDLVIWYVP